MILLRHGQSEFNLHFTQSRQDPGIEDPKLTPLGHEQAERAAEALGEMGLTRIIASPYTRALQTATPIARRLGLPITITPVVRERYAFVCDVGSRRSALEAAWPGHDFSVIEEVWWPGDEEPMTDVERRAAAFRAEVAASEHWDRTLVVSHWGFILALTGSKIGNGEWLRLSQ